MFYSEGSIGSYWDIYHMPIVDRRYNIKLLEEVLKSRKTKDPNTLTMEDMVKGKKSPKVPDYVTKAPAKK